MNTTELTEYFAAHAPVEIPEWFEVKEIEKPKEPKFFALYSDQDPLKEDMKKWHYKYNDGDIDAKYPEEIEFYAKAWIQHYKDIKDFHNNNKERRYFEWRWYYALKMTLSNPNLNAIKK